uniref:Appr-1-p processing enzyme family protein n=1 Tax=Rhizophora mucronata TaxID=61149 RepID=A0A2P2NPK2_RHIMU
MLMDRGNTDLKMKGLHSHNQMHMYSQHHSIAELDPSLQGNPHY